MEKMATAMYQEKNMVPIPKKYKKTAVAAYNTRQEAEAFAEELSQETGFSYNITVDNQSGSAVVQQIEQTIKEKADEETELAAEYGYIPFEKYGFKETKDILLFGTGDLLDLFTYQPNPEDSRNSELVARLEETREKYNCPCYAVVFRNLCGNEERLVAIRKSAMHTADGLDFSEGMTVYNVKSNDEYTVKKIEYIKFEPKQDWLDVSGKHKYLKCFVIAPFVNMSYQHEGNFGTSLFCFDFQFGSEKIESESFESDFCKKEYSEPVLFKTTLWNAQESKQVYHIEEHQRKQAANKLFKFLNKEQVILTRIMATGLITGILAIAGFVFHLIYQYEIVDTKDITVTASSSSSQYTYKQYGKSYPTYELIDTDGTIAYFVISNGDTMDIPADNKVTITINTHRNGKKTASYKGKEMTRVLFDSKQENENSFEDSLTNIFSFP